MADIRPRLTQTDVDLIVRSLRARLAMLSPADKYRAGVLIERLEDSGPGNPMLRFTSTNKTPLNPIGWLS